MRYVGSRASSALVGRHDCAAIAVVANTSIGSAHAPSDVSGTRIADSLDMTPNSIPSQQIVVGFDFSSSARAAMLEALTLAAQMPSRVLHILCVIGPHTPIPGIAGTPHVNATYAATVQEALEREIGSHLVGAKVAGRLQFFVYARIGDAAEELLALAVEVGADRIVLGGVLHEKAEHVAIGAVTERVLRDAGCTVEIARPKAYQRVDLLKIVNAPPHAKYIPPHRYSYEESRMELRPRDWPLY